MKKLIIIIFIGISLSLTAQNQQENIGSVERIMNKESGKLVIGGY